MKVKRIIEVDEEIIAEMEKFPHRAIKIVKNRDCTIADAILNGTPYNSSGDCISRSDLRKTICDMDFDFGDYYDHTDEIIDRVCEKIDSAQAIPLPNEQIAWEQGYEAGLAQGKHENPKGKCCGVCYLCDVGDCGADMKGGAE